jgi:thymidine kinase
MAKLYFRYGAMGSGKTIDLLKVSFNYKERGQKTLILTSSIDNRYGIGKIKSRIGIEEPAICISNADSILTIFKLNCIDENNSININCILVDEVQFFNEKQILELSDIVDNYNIPVIAYGLKSDFKQELFPGSKALLSICDVIENIPAICWCGKKATVNARILDNKIVYDGNQILVGGNEQYISLCRKHWKEGKINK